jgi:RNA polymerase sigma-70 factor (ECF subfamily)
MLESLAMRLDLDPSAFFDEFHPRVFRFVAAATGAPAADVDDLVQETLLEAWTNRAQFRGDSSLLTWVLSIARNRVKMRLRSLGKKASLETALRAIDREEIPPDLIRSEEAAGAVRRALDAIDPHHADVLLRRYFDGLPVRTIADQLGESEKAVESRLHRAREALRERLIQGGDDEL